MLESVLFSRDSDDGSDEIDMFEVLNKQNAWADITINSCTLVQLGDMLNAFHHEKKG